MSDDVEPTESDATVAFDPAKERPPDIEIAGYRVISRLGHGGMGAVYLAEDLNLGRRVAIKVVADAIAKDAAIRARFLREARLLATVEHTNVVRVYSFGASEERAYLVMEYVEGETLSDRIRGGPMPVDEAKKILLAAVDALEAAWEKRVVHRDIKPSNILFDRRGALKVADFGLAKGGESGDTDSSLTQTGYLLGSPHYVAPEQAQGREADFRADIYSLGVTLFEMLTSRKPFDGGTPLSVIAQHLHSEMPSVSRYRSDLPSGVVRLVEWMTAKDPAQRPESYEALRAAIEKLDAPAVSRVRAPLRGGKPLLRFAAALCGALTVALFIFFAVRGRRSPPAASEDSRLVVAVAPFWGPDADSAAEGRSMAALVQQQIVTRLGGAARVIGIDDTKVAVRDTDSARALGERLGATAVIWGQAFALHNEREIQPSLTLVPRKRTELSNTTNATAAFNEARSLESALPAAPEAIRVQSQTANQIDLRKTSAEGIGDLVSFVAAMHALMQRQPQRALELLSRARRTADALYQTAVCLAEMRRDDDAARELAGALKLDPAHAPSLAMLADIDARAMRFADAAAHLRAAAATGRRFTTSEAALYQDKLYVKERYPNDAGTDEAPTMLAIDPVAGKVLDRWELPGFARAFVVDDTGLTVRCDVGPPRSGDLVTLHFVNDRFQGQPPPHATVSRIRRMRPGWAIPTNFTRDLGAVGLKLPVAHFVYSPIEAKPWSPKTLPELKDALEKAIARDPTQPWHRMYLALTIWELGDRAAANRIIDEMFAQPNRTPYYEFAWMIRTLEPLGHRDWADRAYAEALKRRKEEGQIIAVSSTLERMLEAPFVRRAAHVSQVAPDPPRDRLWLTRARELTGVSWDGDEIASAAWGRYLRAHGDERGAKEEEAVHDEAHRLFGGAPMALAFQDVAKAAQVALFLTAVVLMVMAWRRERTLGALSPGERSSLAVLAILLVTIATARLISASRVRLVEGVPVPMSDALAHPVIVATLDQILTERDSPDLRFVAGVSHQLAGDVQRAAELYRSTEWEYATDNLRSLDSAPSNQAGPEIVARAFHSLCVEELWQTIGAAWGVRPAAGSLYFVAFEASLLFFLSLLFAASLLFLSASARTSQRSFAPVAVALLVAGTLFVGIALINHRAATARPKLSLSGQYSEQWQLPLAAAYPFPPDPTSEQALQRAMARSEAMRLFWISVAAGVLAAATGGALLARERLRQRRERAATLLDQPVDVMP
jgi:tetratricopeptide (TPR) repeat protein/predicted Ser/Thr protein kinase